MLDGQAYRPDIDGLRAVAILAVVAFHARIPGMSGGFVGVDVFFVISGFLITGLLSRSLETRGRIDLVDFCARRVRRIVPALALVVVATVLAGVLLLLPFEEQPSLGRSAIAVAGFAANLFFRAQATYFNPRSEFLPLLHTWTLSMEEQFYLLWPLILALAFWAARRSGRSPAVWRAGAVALVSLASFVACVAVTPRWSEWAFYMTPFRVWEFGVGGLLALTPRAPGPRLAAVLTAGGLCAICLSAVVISRKTLFPGLGALPPVLGASAVLAGGLTTNPVSGILGARAPAFVGKISYGWYLWHWPLLALLAATFKSTGPTRLAACTASFGLAILTWQFVERPIRDRLRAPWPTLATGAALLACCAICGAGLVVRAERTPLSKRWLAAKTAQLPPALLAGCETTSVFRHLPTVAECRKGPPPPASVVLLWGDSHAKHFAASLISALRELNVGVVPRLKPSCGVRLSPRAHLRSGEMYGENDCLKFNRAVFASASDFRAEGGVGAVLASRWAHATIAGSGLQTAVARLRGAGLRVLILADVPQYPTDAWSCVARRGWTACNRPRAQADAARRDELAALHRIAASDPGVRLFDPIDSLCSAAVCSPVRGEALVYRDTNHLTRAGADIVVRDMARDLEWVAGRGGVIHSLHQPSIAPSR